MFALEFLLIAFVISAVSLSYAIPAVIKYDNREVVR